MKDGVFDGSEDQANVGCIGSLSKAAWRVSELDVEDSAQEKSLLGVEAEMGSIDLVESP